MPTTTTTRPDPWDRRPGETDEAWKAFTTYRDLGPNRGITAVAKELHKSRTLIGRWSSKHQWVPRVQAFDREDDRRFIADMRQERKEIARRHLRLANVVQGKVVERLQTIDVKTLKPADLIRWLEVTAKIQKDALAITIDGGTEVTVNGEVVVSVESLTDEQRRARMAALKRELESRLAAGDEELADAAAHHEPAHV